MTNEQLIPAENRQGGNVDTHIDPVCGMSVYPETAAGKYDYDGQTYYFCNKHCLNKFIADPAAFLNKSKPHAQEGVKYTCPMHPEIVHNAPGSCPICGMALEPLTVTLEVEENPELKSMTRRFLVSLALTLPVFLLAMSEMIPGQPVQHALSTKLINWVQFVLATPVVLWGGWPFFHRGWESIINRSPNMFADCDWYGRGIHLQRCRIVVSRHLPRRISQSRRGSNGLF